MGHWDGRTWTNGENLIPSGANFAQIALPSTSDGWAIGTLDNGQHVGQPAIFHWDGTQWTALVTDQTNASLAG